MARVVPGSGAVIEPIFNEVYGVRAVKVIDGGRGYSVSDPPRLTVTGCGTPVREALLYPIIDEDSGKIIHVRVLDPGLGYDPLRLSIIPEQDTPNVVTSFDVLKIWQKSPNSETDASFTVINNDITDRLRIVSDGHPKPADYPGERDPGGGILQDNPFDRTFIYRGGKDVPNLEERLRHFNRSTAILSNGVLLHTPDWGQFESTPIGFDLDTVKYPYLLDADEYDGVTNNGQYFYHSSKLINHFSRPNSVFENGFLRPFVWNIKVEFDNILINIRNVSESVSLIEEGRIVEVVNGTGRAEIAKIIKDNTNTIVRIYLRSVVGNFSKDDLLLGSTGFTMEISDDPIQFSNGLFYIDFGPGAAEFGNFTPNTYYLAPTNIRVPKNYLIIWNQSDISNQPSDIHPNGHPMQFSTTPDGPLNQTPGTLYYNSTGLSNAPAADYENEFQPLFIMNGDETDRIYYFCKYHNYMSGYDGDEGYIVIGDDDNTPVLNDYYTTNYYESGGVIDYSRHVSGHSKIIGLSFDGYPIYGPYGYDDSGNIIKVSSSYRLKVGEEVDGARPTQVTPSTITYTVTFADQKVNIDGSPPNFLTLDRGSTYIFNQDDPSNNSEHLFISTVGNGWHVGFPPIIGDTTYLYTDGITYHLDGVEVPYETYLSLFNGASAREIRFTPRVDSPRLLYIFSYTTPDTGFRIVQEGYEMGSFIQDYIYEEGYGDLDEFNGRFSVTPEYPNGTYAYFLTTDSSDNPVYPYAIGPKYYGVPIFEDTDITQIPTQFPSGAFGEVVLDDNGSVAYIKMTRNGDGYFGPTKAKILGGEGVGATANPIVQTVTSLTLLSPGRSFATPPTLIFEGGGGQGARGAASIDTTGKIVNIEVVNPGEFYQEPPYILITGGGGIGAKAVARVDQGEIVGIDITDPGKGYINSPSIIFTKLVNLKRKVNNRQSYNSNAYNITGLTRNLASSDTSIYVNSTDAFPGSGNLLIDGEIVSYSSKSRERFTGVTRGLNFNYDQRIILDSGQNDEFGVSTYKFSVGDRVIRRIENQNNKVAKVYDWDPETRELLVTFEVDELAFIDAGIPSTEDAIVQFDAGASGSATGGFDPHVLIQEEGAQIITLTEPIGRILNFRFEDDDELEGEGDGIPDLVNTGTDYENQINLDGGLFNSLYGIEETIGGQNTTLFVVGDQVKDASLPFKFATVLEAGQLSEGVPHDSTITVYVDGNFGNGQNYFPGDIVTGENSGVRATVVSWDPSNGILLLNNIVPYNTGNVNIGVAGLLYKFSESSTVIDFIVLSPGADYSATPSITIENISDIQATATANMTPSGDQIDSITITNGGYGYKAYIDETNNYRPTTTITNDPGDVTGSGAVVQAVLGGEKLNANSGASYRIKRIEYDTLIRSL